jgi:hypothetical protein
MEVKSGENLRSVSFRLFCEKYQPPKAIRASLSTYQKEDWLLNAPLYVVGDFLV